MTKAVILQAIFPGCVAQNDKVQWIAVGCESVPTLENGGARFVGEGADRHLEVTFKIRKGWRWTDGTPVTAGDAVYAWKLMMDPDFPNVRVSIEKIYNVVAVDDRTILYIYLSSAQARAAEAGTLTGNVPFAAYKSDYVLSAFSASGGAVVDPAYFSFVWWLPSAMLSKVPAKDQAASEFARKPMGDGPYIVKDWKAGQEIDLVKSDQPYPLGEPKIANIVYRFFPDTKSVIAALRRGEIDGTTTVSGLSANDSLDLDLIAKAGDYKVDYLPQYAWEHIDFNVTKFPLDDVRVRQALSMAIDKQSIIDTLFSGKNYAIDLPGAVLPATSWAYMSDYPRYPYDVKAAAALLASAGWDCKA
jgi:ABC-type transport system substrate-binding protein